MRKPAGADVLPISHRENESQSRAVARAYMRPTVNAALTLSRVLSREDVPDIALTDLADELGEQCGKVIINGDLARPEAVLLVQAETLNAMFNDLARLAYDHLPEHGDSGERLLRLALRAQNQARATIETLALMMNPPVVFAKQANIATNGGQQQVNNGVARAHPQEIHDSGRSELLEKPHGEPRLDTRTTSSTGDENSVLATVGVLNGAENGPG